MNTIRKWCVRKDEQDNHGACKEYEIACWFALTVLGRCCRYYLLHIIFVIPMIVNDVNLSVAFRGVSGLSS
jgi:hypothetical protein